MDLFTSLNNNQTPVFVPMKVSDGELLIMENFIQPSDAANYFKILLETINWRQEEIKYYGKLFDVPRKTSWHGDDGNSYTYSGINCNPERWTNELIEIKQKIEKEISGEIFNSVLLNLYRDGNDKVSWHADNEKELGINPTIASVSLGAIRRFDIKHKANESEIIKIDLKPGSLIVMKGAFQHNWLHQIPVQKKVINPRINLTFRTIKF